MAYLRYTIQSNADMEIEYRVANISVSYQVNLFFFEKIINEILCDLNYIRL